MILGIILTALLGITTMGAINPNGSMDKPTPEVREYYGPGDYGNE